MQRFVFERAGNAMGKGENADYQHFHIFTFSFQKAIFLKVNFDKFVKNHGFLLSRQFFQLSLEIRKSIHFVSQSSCVCASFNLSLSENLSFFGGKC